MFVFYFPWTALYQQEISDVLRSCQNLTATFSVWYLYKREMFLDAKQSNITSAIGKITMNGQDYECFMTPVESISYFSFQVYLLGGEEEEGFTV